VALRLLYKGATYRSAWTVTALVQKILAPLWPWIAKLGLSPEDILSFFKQFFPTAQPSRQGAPAPGFRNFFAKKPELRVPNFIKDNIALLLSTPVDSPDGKKVQLSWADFVEALWQALEKPPTGYRWDKDSTGTYTLHAAEGRTEKSLVQGPRFADTVFIGIWWTTKVPKSIENISLRAFIEMQGTAPYQDVYGDVFLKAPYEDKTQYGAFVVLPRMEAENMAQKVCLMTKAAAEKGDGEYRLSAIMLTGAADRREIRASDQVKLGCINSIKFNWEYNLPDLLMGRVTEYKNSGDMKTFLDELNAYRLRDFS
jgi:hypothetical protein